MKKPRWVHIDYDPEAEIGQPSVAAVVADKRRSTQKKTTRRAAPRTTSLPRSHLVRLNKDRCEWAAGVKFDARAWAELEWLAEYCVLYTDPRRSYIDPGVEGRRAKSFMLEDFKPPLLSGAGRKQRAEILPMLVAGVAKVFHANGGEKRERLTRLLRSLFAQAGGRPPAARTLRQAVTSTTES